MAWPSHPKSVHSVKTDTSMAWIKKYRSSIKRAYWTRTNSCGQPKRDCSKGQLDKNQVLAGLNQSNKLIPYNKRHTGQEPSSCGQPFFKDNKLQRAYQTGTNSCSQPKRDYSNTKVLVFTLFRLSFHVVGKGVCLVLLCQNSKRRDKQWNYIQPEFQRYTKHILES